MKIQMLINNLTLGLKFVWFHIRFLFQDATCLYNTRLHSKDCFLFRAFTVCTYKYLLLEVYIPKFIVIISVCMHHWWDTGNALTSGCLCSTNFFFPTFAAYWSHSVTVYFMKSTPDAEPFWILNFFMHLRFILNWVLDVYSWYCDSDYAVAGLLRK
jgi:hypothetical protein